MDLDTNFESRIGLFESRSLDLSHQFSGRPRAFVKGIEFDVNAVDVLEEMRRDISVEFDRHVVVVVVESFSRFLKVSCDRFCRLSAALVRSLDLFAGKQTLTIHHGDIDLSKMGSRLESNSRGG
jgi:hypothetical protein